MPESLIITDCPAALDGFAETGGQFDLKAAELSRLPLDTRHTWQAVGGLGQAEIVCRNAPAPWRQIMAVGHSAVSQMDAFKHSTPLERNKSTICIIFKYDAADE